MNSFIEKAKSLFTKKQAERFRNDLYFLNHKGIYFTRHFDLDVYRVIIALCDDKTFVACAQVCKFFYKVYKEQKRKLVLMTKIVNPKYGIGNMTTDYPPFQLVSIGVMFCVITGGFAPTFVKKISTSNITHRYIFYRQGDHRDTTNDNDDELKHVNNSSDDIDKVEKQIANEDRDDDINKENNDEVNNNQENNNDKVNEMDEQDGKVNEIKSLILSQYPNVKFVNKHNFLNNIDSDEEETSESKDKDLFYHDNTTKGSELHLAFATIDYNETRATEINWYDANIFRHNGILKKSLSYDIISDKYTCYDKYVERSYNDIKDSKFLSIKLVSLINSLKTGVFMINYWLPIVQVNIT